MWLGLALLAGCHGPPAGDPPARTDADGDTIPADRDCDDANPAVGEAHAWLEDRDGDGFTSGVVTEACAAPAGHVTEAAPGDCDDADASVHPGAEERCDGLDRDCDGSPSPAQSWFPDGDADGWGADDGAVAACEAPAGFAAASGDCDDADGATWPGGWDRCGDGTDQDCDGADATICRYPRHAAIEDVAITFEGGESGGYLGYAVAGVGDQTGDGLADAALGAPSESSGSEGNGHLYIVRAFAGRHIAQNVATATIGGAGPWNSYFNRAGASVVGLGDVTGDGIADVADHAWLISGPIRGERLMDEVAVGRYAYTGSYTYASPGDLDGDGIGEVAVGAQIYVAAGEEEPRGAVYLYSSPPSLLEPGDESSESLLIGEPRDGAGYHVAGAGDTDGDGRGDLLVGAPSNKTLAQSAGAAYLVTEVPPGESRLIEVAAARLLGHHEDEYVGGRVASAGDADGDGYADVLLFSETDIADPEYGIPEQWVCASLVHGPMSGDLDLETASAVRYIAETPYDCRAGDVAGPGDLDGDGFDDVALGAAVALNADSAPTGAVYIDYAPGSGVVNLADVDVKLYSDEAYTLTGWALDPAGDMDGDGFPDLLVGAPQAGIGGRAYIVLGGQ